MIGNFITVQQLYDYALQHNYLKTDAKTVLDIINREKRTITTMYPKESAYSNPTNNTNTDFSSLVEYTIEDLLTLFST